MDAEQHRKIDVAVGEHIMGKQVTHWPTGDWFCEEGIPHYSVLISEAWNVVDHFLSATGNGAHYQKEEFARLVREFGMGDLVRWPSDKAAQIICRAALGAVGVEI